MYKDLKNLRIMNIIYFFLNSCDANFCLHKGDFLGGSRLFLKIYLDHFDFPYLLPYQLKYNPLLRRVSSVHNFTYLFFQKYFTNIIHKQNSRANEKEIFF